MFLTLNPGSSQVSVVIICGPRDSTKDSCQEQHSLFFWWRTRGLVGQGLLLNAGRAATLPGTFLVCSTSPICLHTFLNKRGIYMISVSGKFKGSFLLTGSKEIMNKHGKRKKEVKERKKDKDRMIARNGKGGKNERRRGKECRKR